jgi:hypothetical protein
VIGDSKNATLDVVEISQGEREHNFLGVFDAPWQAERKILTLSSTIPVMSWK